MTLAEAVQSINGPSDGLVLTETLADGGLLVADVIVDRVQLVRDDGRSGWINLVLMDGREHVRHIVDWHDDGLALALTDEDGREIDIARLDPDRHSQEIVDSVHAWQGERRLHEALYEQQAAALFEAASLMVGRRG